MLADMACGSCGTQLRATARFCDQCGAPIQVADAPEFKQVTVLFADVVHSMHLAAALDVERYREIISELVQRSAAVIARYDGIVNYTGDGVMAVFGAPVALEDHAFRACVAALSIQDEAARVAAEVARRDGVTLQLRVGLNSGRVIGGEIGTGALGYSTVGEQVGYAQRMESVARPGTVVLSQSTAHLVEHIAKLGEPELVHIKGADEPVSVRRLVSIGRRRHRVDRTEAGLAGRGAELAALKTALDGAIDGHGGVVHVVGVPGVGKSRVAREAAALAAARGVRPVWTFCESHTHDIPFHAVVELLRVGIGITDQDAHPARIRLRKQLPNADPQDLMLLADLLGIADQEAPPHLIDPDARRRRLTALITTAIQARAEPALLIIEDVHWIDDVSDSLLADFLAVVAHSKLLVLISSRPEYVGALSQTAGTLTIVLDPLEDSETSSLLTELMGTDPSLGRLITAITERAAGNPFFAEEMVRELVQRGVLRSSPDGYTCDADITEINVPVTVQAAIEARIDRLTAPAKRTLHAASVIGGRFGAELLERLTSATALSELVRAELIDQTRSSPHAEYTFRHPLIRAVAYESQLKSGRAHWHRCIADVIESRDPGSVDENATAIAEHLQAAGDPAAAYSWRMRAGAWLANRDITAARASWERASQIADGLPGHSKGQLSLRIAPRTMLCATDFQARGVSESRGRFAELRALCDAADDKVALAIGMTGLATELNYAGRIREAALLSSEQMALLESIGNPDLTAGLSFMAFINWFDVAKFEELSQWSHTVIELTAGDPTKGAGFGIGSPLAIALVFRGVAHCWQGHPGWRRDLDTALARAKESDTATNALVLCWAYSGVAYGVRLADDHGLQAADELVRTAEQESSDVALKFAEYVLGYLLLYADTPAERQRGLELMTKARDWQRERMPSLVPVTELIIAARSAEPRDLDATITLIRKVVDDLQHAGRLAYGLLADGLLTEALIARGTEVDLAEAQAVIDRMADQWTSETTAIPAITLLRLRTLRARATGDEITYRDQLNRYRELATSLGFEGHITWSQAL